MPPVDDEQPGLDPTEQRGGAVPGDEEAQEKGPWASRAQEGVVPPELGGSDAREEVLPDDPELGSDATGRAAQSEAPATEAGIDRGQGDSADATEQGGPETPAGAEPDLRDAASGPRQADVESAE
jgi:hypothetical protein